MITDLYFGILPTVVGIASILWSWVISWKTRSFLHGVVSFIVFLSIAWSLSVLYRIYFLRAWATFLPHLVIGVAAIMVMVQAFLTRKIRAKCHRS